MYKIIETNGVDCKNLRNKLLTHDQILTIECWYFLEIILINKK